MAIIGDFSAKARICVTACCGGEKIKKKQKKLQFTYRDFLFINCVDQCQYYVNCLTGLI